MAAVKLSLIKGGLNAGELDATSAPLNGRIEVPTITARNTRDMFFQLKRAGYSQKEWRTLHFKEPDEFLNTSEQIAVNFAISLAAYQVIPQNMSTPIALVIINEGEMTISIDRLIKGKTLEQIHDEAQRTMDQNLALGYRWFVDDLVGIIDFLHSKGRYHGDPNLSNVMVTPDGTLKLIDFDAHVTVKQGQAQDQFVLQEYVVKSANDLLERVSFGQGAGARITTISK